MQNNLERIYTYGPDWPEWEAVNPWCKDRTWRDPFLFGDRWGTRMEGVLYLVSWDNSRWTLYRSVDFPLIGSSFECMHISPFLGAYSKRVAQQVEEGMRWVMESLPQRIILWTL